MKKTKDIVKFINSTKKKYNYHWETQGKEIIQKINLKNVNKEELKKILSILLITEDIPNNILLDFWLTCSGAKEDMEKNKGQYKKLVQAFNILIKNKHPFYLYLQKKMSIDLNRSFTGEIKATEENINQLRDILSAFTVRDATLNYCQGLNAIVAYLLKMTNFKEEESFYLFLNLMEKILPYDFYLFGIGVEAEMSILQKLLEKDEPDLMKHLNHLDGGMVIYSNLTQFITSLLIFKTNKNITNILFNCFFGFALLENKNDVFFYFYKIIIGIFRILKHDLMKCKNMQQINEVLKLEKDQKKENIQSIIYYTLFDESKNKFDINYAKKLRLEEVQKVMKDQKYKFNFKNENNIDCNINYPICIEEWNISSPPQLNVIYQSINDINEGEDNNIINTNKNIINDEDNDERILKEIIVERRRHYCFIKKIKEKYNYKWQKEGQEIISKMNENNINKKEIKKILSFLLISEPNIPKDLLLNFWLTFSGAHELITQNKSQYKKLVRAFNILIKKKHPFYLYMEKKISVDLNRSFGKMINKVNQDNINQLRDILYAFLIRNVSINYCQGLNGIVAYILKMTNFKEEESFYLFLNLMENILPYDYYLFAIGVEVELNILLKLLEKYEPDLIKHLNQFENGVILISTLTKFITSLMIFKTDQNITNFTFNCFFGFAQLENKNESFYYFHKIILSIFKSLKPDLMKCTNMREVSQVINIENEENKGFIESIIYYTLFDESANKLDISYVKNLRKEEINKIIQNRKTKFNFKNENNIECNINYPLCVEECNNSSPIELNVIHKSIINNKDDNNDNDNKINNEREDDEDILKSIIVERRGHYCLKNSLNNK